MSMTISLFNNFTIILIVCIFMRIRFSDSTSTCRKISSPKHRRYQERCDKHSAYFCLMCLEWSHFSCSQSSGNRPLSFRCGTYLWCFLGGGRPLLLGKMANLSGNKWARSVTRLNHTAFTEPPAFSICWVTPVCARQTKERGYEDAQGFWNMI